MVGPEWSFRSLLTGPPLASFKLGLQRGKQVEGIANHRQPLCELVCERHRKAAVARRRLRHDHPLAAALLRDLQRCDVFLEFQFRSRGSALVGKLCGKQRIRPCET
jgi:hypothetical protein